MANSLKVYKNINGEQSPFPNKDEQVVVSSFRYDAKRMGGAPIISCVVNHEKCLDNLWSRDVFVEFRGEKHYLKQTPTSSYNNTDVRYKHEVEFVSERVILDDVYFYDVVTSDVNVDKVVSNSTSFTFSGDIHEFAKRLNMSLVRLNVGYTVEVDSGVKSDVELVTFENQFITNVLQTMYDVYKIPYYFVGKVIRIGEYQDTINKVFKYGATESFLSITKNNANSKTINRITGQGSSDNIPYYYPNDDAKGLTSVLYNGKVGVASIINQSLYRKVKLSDKFVYENNAQTRVSLLNESNYHFGSARIKQQEQEEGKPEIDKGYLYSVDFYYTIVLNDGENVAFNVSSQHVTKNLKFEIYKISSVPSVHYGTFKDSVELSLTGGTYNFIVKWEFYSDVVFEFDNDIHKFVEENLVVSADIVVDSTNTWTYNGIPVNLESYGLSVPSASNGDTISFRLDKYIHPQPKLMPSIYRNSEGDERFYNAINDTYKNDNGDGYYVFDNVYTSTHPKEHIENFDNIKPTIKNVQNAQGEYIDSFIDFAYDELDNDDVDENNEFIHPYFYAKLRRFNGDYGFNLFDHAIESNEMVVSMVDGSCASCEFAIMVDSKTQKNTVLVDSNGNLLRDSKGNVKRGTPQDEQNDTINNEVWITLKKNLDTYGVIMPNASNKYKPLPGDKFVLLHIDLPKVYVEAAEKKLEKELIKFMAENNSEKFSFSISFSRIFFKENPNVLNSLTENSKIKIEYNGQEYDLYVSSISYNVDESSILPDIRVEIADVLSISQNQIQQIVLATEKRLLEKIGDTPKKTSIVEQTVPTYNGSSFDEDNFLRKDQDDRSSGLISSDKGFEVGKYVAGQIGGYGARMYMDENEKSILEIDKIHAREELIVPTITFNTIEVVNGDKANTFAFGRIKDVEVLDETHGIVTLDLLEDEYGTVKAYDILRGVYHNIEGGNETETKEDGNGFMQYSGFFTSYFSPTIVESSKGRMVFRYVLQTGANQRPVCPHPCAGMNFYAYGNFKDKDRQSITYETRDYRRRLVDMSTWGITPKNIVMQDGKLDNLTVGGFTMSGYGTFQTNSYFTGVQIQFTPDQLQEIKGEDSYAVTLSSYEGVLKIDGEGKVTKAVSQANVTVGGMNVTVTSSDGEKKNVVVTDFSLKTTIQASRGSTTLFYSEEPITGAYMASLRCIGCDGFISNGTVIITDVFDLEHCEVTISVSCEGKYPVEKTYRINAVYDGKIFEMETIYSKLQTPTPPADDVHPYKGEEWSEEFDKDMIWQATSNKKEDKWTPWVITRLKGFSYRISPESVSVGRTMTGSLSPDIIDFTCYKMMDDGKMEPTPAVWHVDKFRAGSWSAYGDYDSREVLTFQVPSSKNEESNKAYRVIARPTLEAEVSLVATVNMVDDGNTTLPRYRKEYDPSEQYVWNKEYRDIVIYDKRVWQVKAYSEDEYVTGVWNESKWTEASKYSFVAMDTALIDGANIAGFTFKENRMISGFADTSGNPTLVIDGKNGNIEAMKGRIGGFTITSGSLDGSWTDESGDAPVTYKGVSVAPDVIQIESNVSNVVMSPTGSAAIYAAASGKNAIEAVGGVLIKGDLTVTGKINGEGGTGGGGNVEIVEGGLPSLENLKPNVLYVVV